MTRSDACLRRARCLYGTTSLLPRSGNDQARAAPQAVLQCSGLPSLAAAYVFVVRAHAVSAGDAVTP